MRKRLALKANESGRTHIEVKVDYSKGGLNYFNGGRDPRGVYAYITPIEIKEDGIMGFIVGQGLKVFMQELKRLDRKKVEAYANEVAAQIDGKSGRVWDAVQKVLAEHKLELAEEKEAIVA
jgi:hypothetical protein